MNEDARAASRGAIARIVDKETAAIERTAAHVIGLDRTDVRALGDRIVERRGGILHADRLPGLELDVAGPPRRSKTEAPSDAEETCRCPVVAFDLLRLLTVLDVEEGVAPAEPGFAHDPRARQSTPLTPAHAHCCARTSRDNGGGEHFAKLVTRAVGGCGRAGPNGQKPRQRPSQKKPAGARLRPWTFPGSSPSLP